jgi:hypothetical protein
MRGKITVTPHGIDRIVIESDGSSVDVTTRKRSQGYSAVAFHDPSHQFNIRPTERLNDAKMIAKGYTHHLTIPGTEPLYVKSIADGCELIRNNYPTAEGFSFRRIGGKRA